MDETFNKSVKSIGQKLCSILDVFWPVKMSYKEYNDMSRKSKWVSTTVYQQVSAGLNGSWQEFNTMSQCVLTCLNMS
jgi:hypothetical protein